jgi:ATP-dependent DNA helicase RecQ
MSQALQILQTVFGHSNFRDGQEQVVQRLLAGHSCLAIFPTGAGKSLCFQLPALLLPGLTLVVSPLIALMKDQVDSLQRNGVAAARLDSSLDNESTSTVYQLLRRGRLKLLYVSPERFNNERFLTRLTGSQISLLAIDEAHCISEWGHNFRPDYLKLPETMRRLQISRVLAVTATAPPAVAREIANILKIQDIVSTPFKRPNLALRLEPCPSDQREASLLRALQPGANIVYVTTQKSSEQVAAFLSQRGRAALAYHAGMENDERARVQDAFMEHPDLVVVATIAFGMGVDKANIRSVIHYNLPKSLENYAQEIGRAGRDGAPALCTLIAAPEDLIPLQNFIYGDTPTTEAVMGLLSELPEQPCEFALSIFQLSRRHDTRKLVVETLLTYLEMEGVLESTGPFYTDYQLAWEKPQAEVLACFDSQRADFLRQLIQRGRQGRIWTHFHLESLLSHWDQPRARVVAALGYLEEKGYIRLKCTGAMKGFRRLPALANPQAILKRFQQREARDLARLNEMWRFAQHLGCANQRLLDYFGEPGNPPCGQCSSCLGHPPLPVGATSISIPDEVFNAIPNHPALSHPRQVTRFLCGIPSPAATAAHLNRHPQFGILEHVPFSQVLLALPPQAA